MNETIPVRPDDAFDTGVVAAYLRRHLPNLGDAPLLVRQFPTGASNLTYHLQIGDWQAVLRRPPRGPVAPKAHDMAREYRILQQLHRAYPRAPRPLLFCDDPAVMEKPFYVMEYRRGAVLDTQYPATWDQSPATFRAITAGVVDALVELHAVDYREAGLAEIGRPEGYLERQVRGWTERYHRARTDEIPVVGRICQWLVDHLPPLPPPPTVIHNDYKLNNLMLAPEEPARVTAVLDWEMSTVGDPLVDLANLVTYWHEPGDPEVPGYRMNGVTALPGFPRRREVLELYARRSGRDLSNIRFYLAFSYFKTAVICQQIYYRWRQGHATNERFRYLGQVVANLLHRAAAVIDGAGV